MAGGVAQNPRSSVAPFNPQYPLPIPAEARCVNIVSAVFCKAEKTLQSLQCSEEQTSCFSASPSTTASPRIGDGRSWGLRPVLASCSTPLPSVLPSTAFHWTAGPSGGRKGGLHSGPRGPACCARPPTTQPSGHTSRAPSDSPQTSHCSPSAPNALPVTAPALLLILRGAVLGGVCSAMARINTAILGVVFGPGIPASRALRNESLLFPCPSLTYSVTAAQDGVSQVASYVCGLLTHHHAAWLQL